jgi:putative MATE family efflux protein
VGGLGEEALAAMGVATAIGGLIIGVLFALANGTQILIAQAFGAVSQHAQKSGFWSGLFVSSCVAAVGIAIFLLWHDSLADKFAKNSTVAGLASSYLFVFTVVIAGLAICQHISVFLYATGKPKLPFYSIVLELPFNALLSYGLIYGYAGLPELGLVGAALGSAVSVWLRAIFLCICLYIAKTEFLFYPGWSQNSFSASVANHLRNALPIAGTFISMHLSVTLCMLIYTQLEVHEFAALTILFLWIRSSGQLVTSWSQATGILVGQLLGQGRVELLDGFVGRAWRVAHVLGFVIALIYASTPILFQWVYPNLEDQTIGVLMDLLPVLILLPLVRSSNTICGNVLRAAGQSGYAFKVHVTAQWLFTVPMSAFLVLILNAPVVWVFAIFIFEELLKGLPFHLRMHSGEWKRQKIVHD